MIYRTLRPRPPLDALVRCFWILRDDAAPGPAPFERVLPDGCPELVFHRADPFQRRHGDEPAAVTQYRAAFVGQLDRWIDIRPTGRVHILGVRFHPAGAPALLRDGAHRFTGRSVPLDGLRGGAGRRLEARVMEAATDREAIAAVEEEILGWTGAPGPPSPVARAAALLERSGGLLPVEEAAAAVGLGRRTLERRFLEEVGLPPKRLARVHRFQEALRHLKDGIRGGPAAAALAAGYYDQSHMHRDFLDFAGDPPARWAEGERPLSDHFIG